MNSLLGHLLLRLLATSSTLVGSSS